jgi:Double zinc ribbon
MNSPAEFNLFVLLELDPDDGWGQERFEKRLKEKQSDWSKMSNHPVKGKAARGNIERLPALKRIAADDVERAKHAEEAKKFRDAGQRERRQELDEAVKLFQAGGQIFETQLKDLAMRYAGVASEDDIRELLNIPVVKGEKSPQSQDELLEPTTVSQIVQHLQVLGKGDLYDFLGLSTKAQPSVLFGKAKDLYDGVHNKGYKDLQATLTSKLAGHCMVLFKDSASKSRYDATLEDMQFDPLRKKLDLFGNDRNERVVIADDQMQLLLRDVRELGLDVVKGRSVIYDYARKKRFDVELSPTSVEFIRKLQRCGYCSRLSEPDAKHCTRCGEPLTEPCPKCGESLPTELGACGKCGFPAGNRLVVKVLCVEAEEAYQSRDYARASDLLQQASQSWPDVTRGPLAEQIQALKVRVAPAKANQDAVLAQLRETVGTRRLYAARDLLGRAEGLYPNGSEELKGFRREIESGLRATMTTLTLARSYNGADPEGQIQIYQAVLEICKDCSEAFDGLAKTPPAEPGGAEARVGGQIVHVIWQPSASRNVSYAIVRKPWSRPVSVADGARLATVAGTSFDDAAPEVGVPVFYSIFADRGGVSSRDGAVVRAPVQILDEVSEVMPRVDNRRVTLTWKAPRNVHGVIVQRSDRAYPKTLNDGDRITVVGSEQAVDAGVVNDRRYYYTIFSQFKGPDGNLLTTPGARLEAIPQEPPEPIRELQISPEGLVSDRHVRIRWSAAKRGNVAIFRSDKPFGVRCGDVVRRDALKEYGSALSGQGIDVLDRLGGAGFRYYLPVTVFQDAAYLGREQRYVCVEEADGLTHQNLGNTLRLQWNWPTSCSEVIVAHSREDWPQPDGDGVTSVHLTRAQYDLRGYFDIPNPTQADHYVAIFTLYSQEGQRVTSAGACRKKISVRSRIEVLYEIKKPWIGNSLKLEVTVNGEGTVPSMVLVRKQGDLPMNKGAGEPVLRMERIPPETRRLELPLPETARRARCFALLFLEDDKGYDFVTIRKPGREKLQLF